MSFFTYRMVSYCSVSFGSVNAHTIANRGETGNTYLDALNYHYGDNITVYGSLVEPSNNTIPNTFNYREYLYNKKIYII